MVSTLPKLAILVFLFGLALSNAVVHKFATQPHRLSEKAALVRLAQRDRHVKAITDSHRFHFNPRHQPLLAAAEQAARAASNTSLPLDTFVTPYSFYALGANVTVGTPPQTLYVELDLFWSSDLTVIGSNADLSSVYDDTPAKHTFNASMSSTFVNQSESFSSGSLGDGGIGKDVLGVGSLSKSVVVDVLDEIYWSLSIEPIDGVLGLFPSDRSNSSNSSVSSQNLVTQLVGDLKLPVVTLWTHEATEAHGGGQLTLGALDEEHCQSNWAYGRQIGYYDYAMNATIVKGVTSRGIVVGIVRNVDVHIRDDLSEIYATGNVFNLFANATNAVWNSTIWAYVTSCDLSQLGIVQFDIGNRTKSQLVTLTPVDFVQYWAEYDKCVLKIHNYGYYFSTDFLLLGRQFLNNHCISYNVKTNEVGLVGTKEAKSFVVIEQPTSSPGLASNGTSNSTSNWNDTSNSNNTQSSNIRPYKLE